MAVITLPDGRRTNRSTGTTDKRKASRIANSFEDASREAALGRFTEARARKTIADIYSLANEEKMQSATVGEFLERWLTRKKVEAGERTHEKYVGVITQFKKHLGPKVKCDIASITANDIAGFRDALAGKRATGTANLALKIVRAAFAQAHRDGLVDTNEATRVTVIKNRDEHERQPFTVDQLRALLKVADDEWRGMIIFGLYTGQRLGDLAGLTWNNIDLERGEVRFVTEKTQRRMVLPLAPPLVKYIESLPAGDEPEAPLFPTANAMMNRHGRSGGLSNQFHLIMVAAGLAKKRTHKADPDKDGRSASRERSTLSFHSLRHTATTLLKAAGVGESVAMEFVGHDSKSISRNYTHIDGAALRSAANKLPDITKTIKPTK